MDERLVKLVADEVLKSLRQQPAQEKAEPIPLEVSARHVHLSRRDVEALFGAGYALTPKRNLSQPGQFLCEERVRLIGPRGDVRNVAVLGPIRSETQAELSATDARALGIDAPIQMSGNLQGAGDLIIMAGDNAVVAKGSAIIAKSHIHMPPEDARRFGVCDKESVRVKVASSRPLTFEDIVVRVSPDFRLALHIDLDEANACNATCGDAAILLGVGGSAPSASADRTFAAALSASPTPAPVRCEQRLISEALAKQLCDAGSEILLTKGTIITPLAKDVFRSAKVVLKEEGIC